MKVIYIGYPKTGTKTVGAALKILGYNVYDYEENFMYLEKEWRKILTIGGTVEDFRKMYSNVDASVDTPVYLFWQNIMEAFPDVKLIFSSRDDEGWANSWETQQNKIRSHTVAQTVMLFSPTVFRFSNYARLINRVCFGGWQYTWPWHLFEGSTHQMLLKRYHQHNIEVLKTAPKSQLLVINYKDGWKPLCEFLEKPIPEVPFPHENKKGDLIRKSLESSPLFRKARRELCVVFVLLSTFLAIAVYYMYIF